jgi:hypothetical protein
MRSVMQLNVLLAKADTPQKLAAAYNQCKPGLGNDQPRDPEFQVLNYCSEAAHFVIGYLTGTPALYMTMCNQGNQRDLTSATAPALLEKILTLRGPYIVLLNATGNGAHECVFVRTGDQWAFYQANYTNAQENFTLVPKLNHRMRNWNFNDMSKVQFESLFTGLTKAEYSAKLFPYSDPMTQWKLAVFSFEGTNLLTQPEVGVLIHR